MWEEQPRNTPACSKIIHKDGFDFYDEIAKFCSENHAIFRIKNESKKSIHSVEINVISKLITDTDKELLDKYSNL